VSLGIIHKQGYKHIWYMRMGTDASTESSWSPTSALGACASFLHFSRHGSMQRIVNIAPARARLLSKFGNFTPQLALNVPSALAFCLTSGHTMHMHVGISGCRHYVCAFADR